MRAEEDRTGSTQENRNRNLEGLLHLDAVEFSYPPTPDIKGPWRREVTVKHRPRIGWALAVMVILIVVASLVAPPVRAAVLEFLQIGGLRIGIRIPATATPFPSGETAAPGARLEEAQPYDRNLLNLSGEMPLEEIRSRVDFPIPLPAHPQDLGIPDHAFLQSRGGDTIILVWRDQESRENVRLSLLILGPGAFAGKGPPERVEVIYVSGNPGVWMEGEHFLILETGAHGREEWIPVRGNVLVWERDGITYRVEADLPKEDVMKIAESILESLP